MESGEAVCGGGGGVKMRENEGNPPNHSLIFEQSRLLTIGGAQPPHHAPESHVAGLYGVVGGGECRSGGDHSSGAGANGDHPTTTKPHSFQNNPATENSQKQD